MKAVQIKPSTIAQRLSSGALTIALGEGLARSANLLLVIFISRTLGVRAAGIYALAQALSLYQMQATDFGLRHIGARLATQYLGSINRVVSFIQRRRIAFAFLTTLLAYWYAKAGPVPSEARTIVSLYAVSMLGYGFSVDWLAWGTERFAQLSAWRVLVSFFGLILAFGSVHLFRLSLIAIPIANGLSYCLADALLWTCWARKFVAANSFPSTSVNSFEAPRWRETAFLGVALVVNQAFNSIDTMMLGGMAGSLATGYYSAAYRMLLLVLAVYWLGMQALFPWFAAVKESERKAQALFRPLFFVAIAGMIAAAAMIALRRFLIAFLYGSAFSISAELARPLLLAIPLDFMTSILLTALVAWGQSQRVLLSTGTAVVTNVLLNCILIPRYGAWGAAFATPLSYIPYLFMLLYQVHQYSLRVSNPHTPQPSHTDPPPVEVHP